MSTKTTDFECPFFNHTYWIVLKSTEGVTVELENVYSTIREGRQKFYSIVKGLVLLSLELLLSL